MASADFDAEFFAMPDGVVTVVVRSPWPSADDVVEELGQSVRRGPKPVHGFLSEAGRNRGGDR
jgi:hypothetical protein